MKPSGCKDCAFRQIGCHTDCEVYQNYLDSLYKMKEEVQKARFKDNEYEGYKKANKRKPRK